MIELTPIKLLVIALFLIVLVSLLWAGVSITRNKKGEDGKGAMRALIMRVALSLLTVGILVVAIMSGSLHPNNSPTAVGADQEQSQ